MVMDGEALRRLGDLVDFPKESLNIELKNWLDLRDDMGRANLAKAFIALANHGGGYVLIGFEKSGGQWVPAEPRPADLTGYSEDDCNAAVARYAEPPFHCDVYYPTRRDSGLQHPIIVVPGGQLAPVRGKRDDPQRKHVRQHDYYIRRPGPKSETPQSGQEWEVLIGRCVRAGREQLLEDIRRIFYASTALPPTPEVPIQLDKWEESSENRWRALLEERFPSIHQSPYAYGTWIVSYAVMGDFPKPSPSELLQILNDVSGRETGWPPWWIPTRPGIAPYPYEGTIECWLNDADDPAYADFWRASSPGLMFLVRGHQEDSQENDRYKLGAIFDLTLPVWRTAEVLLHASRLATALRASDAEVHLKMRWTGMKDRELVSWAQPSIHLSGGRFCHQDEVNSRLFANVATITDQLPELVADLTRPLYEVFDFFVPSMTMYQQQLAKLRSSRI